DERRIPVEPIIAAALARILGPNHREMASLQIAAYDTAVLHLGVDDIRIAWIDAADKAIAAEDRIPIVVRGPGLAKRAARTAPAAVVLKAAINIIGLPRVDADVVELAQRHVIVEIPIVAAIVADVDAAVAAQHDMPAIARIKPHGMMIRMHAL